MNPEKMPNGRWKVGDKDFDTNAQAWRYIDQQGNEPLSRSEETSNWSFKKIASGE